MVKIEYAHTNIISKDWKKLADFYIRVFDCLPLHPKRDQKGEWLDKGTGLKEAHIKGMHLRLPGYNDNAPTLEIYQYENFIEDDNNSPNKLGFRHIAFRVSNVKEILEKALNNGAKKLGEISEFYVENVGLLTFIYISDPDGNIIELQNWS
ncbi:MAG: VOC family protein [Candidatus Sericytochromatia bacterium]